MSGHALSVTFDGWLNVVAVCNESKEADCRLTSAGCECEEWGPIRYRNDGTIWHRVVNDGEGFGPLEPLWHQVARSELCNVCEYLNNDGDILELAVKDARFTIGEIPIKPVWTGDGYEWEPVEP